MRSRLLAVVAPVLVATLAFSAVPASADPTVALSPESLVSAETAEEPRVVFDHPVEYGNTIEARVEGVGEISDLRAEWRLDSVPGGWEWFTSGSVNRGQVYWPTADLNELDFIGNTLSVRFELTLADGSSRWVDSQPVVIAQGTPRPPRITFSTPVSVGSSAAFVDVDGGTGCEVSWYVDGKLARVANGFAPEAAHLGGLLKAVTVCDVEGYKYFRSESASHKIFPGEHSFFRPWASGARKVGETLTAQVERRPNFATLNYRWMRDGKPISGATATKYELTLADAGHEIGVSVTAKRAGFVDRTITGFVGIPPRLKLNAGRVSLSGTPKTGKVLSATAAGWPVGSALKYGWLRNGKPIAKATARTYKLTAKDVGARIAVRVTASKVGYSIPTKTSASVIAKKNSQRLGKVVVSGQAKVGSKLIAKVSGWQSGVKFTYVWTRDGIRIDDANRASYKLAKYDAGHDVRVRVVAKLPGYFDRTVKPAAKYVRR